MLGAYPEPMSEGHRLFAWGYDAIARRAEARDGSLERRRDALAGARGRVLEVGAGTGLNLQHYPPEQVTEVLATEPDPYMFRRLARALERAPAPTRLQRASAEALPVADGWADTVVLWLVLCSVPDQDVALREIRRVLAPSGRLIVCEHVRSQNPRSARRQDRWARPWGWVGAGCHPNRDTAAAIERAGFAFDELERFDVRGSALANPHIRGVATVSR